MKIYFLALFILTSTTSVFAKSSQNSLRLTPIIGLERVQQALPTPTMKTRGIFGMLVVYQFEILSLEAEFTYGQNTNTDAANDTSYKYTDGKLKLGVRGDYQLADFLSYHLNGGGQLTQNEIVKTVAGTTSTTTNTTKVNPYIGTGISIHVKDTASVTASITVVYKPTSISGLSDFEYQPSLGFGVNF